MTPDQMETLARTLTAHHRWKWTPGMLAVVPPAHDGSTGYMLRISSVMDQPPARAYPDLTDSATLGCLLALVREAWGDPYLCCVGDQETGWRLDGYAAVADLHSFHSEAEALVYALEAAP